MLSVEDALQRILFVVPVLEPETKPVLDAIGQTLAEDVVSQVTIPPWNNSAMDGYAVRNQDIAGASSGAPRVLRVIGMVAAGQIPAITVQSGTAIRVMTGAPIPLGADTVVAFEETDEVQRKESGKHIAEIGILKTEKLGASVRPAGEDFRNGDVVLAKGTLLTPAVVGILVSVGMSSIRVLRRPIVTILSTGDELQSPGAPLAPGKTYDSNSYGVAAAVLRAGGIPRMLGVARDDIREMNDKFDAGMQADLFLTTAGVSKGDYDFVKDVLAQRGTIEFWSVRMRPAKPLAFSQLKMPSGAFVPHVGLPGNPVSAMISFELLVRPAILKMQGRTRFARPVVEATMEDDITNYDERRVYARVLVTKRNGVYYARLTGPQGSNLLTPLSKANGLAICPEDVPVLRKGERAQVQMLDWPEEGVF